MRFFRHARIIRLLFADKRAKNLCKLVARADPTPLKISSVNVISPDQTDHGYKKCGLSGTLVIILFLKKTCFVGFATGTEFKIHRDSTCNTKNAIYLAYCKKCNEQGVESCIEWKPPLINYKIYTKNKNTTSRIVKLFAGECNNHHVPFKYLGFLLLVIRKWYLSLLHVIYRKNFYKKMILNNAKNLKKMLRKSPASFAWAPIFKNGDFSRSLQK